jgi:hypothetical protein
VDYKGKDDFALILFGPMFGEHAIALVNFRGCIDYIMHILL